MKKLLAILLIIVIISSCNTTKRMQNQLAKLHVNHPEKLAEYCAVQYPVKETVTVVKGRDSFIYETITVDCDSAFAELQKQFPNDPIEVIREKLKTVFVPKIETKYRVDTIVRVQENTAEIEALRMKLSGLEQAYNDRSEQYAKSQKNSGVKTIIIGIMATLAMLYFVLKFKRII